MFQPHPSFLSPFLISAPATGPDHTSAQLQLAVSLIMSNRCSLHSSSSCPCSSTCPVIFTALVNMSSFLLMLVLALLISRTQKKYAGPSATRILPLIPTINVHTDPTFYTSLHRDITHGLTYHKPVSCLHPPLSPVPPPCFLPRIPYSLRYARHTICRDQTRVGIYIPTGSQQSGTTATRTDDMQGVLKKNIKCAALADLHSL